ncbi:non-ribosomal peptide synthetase [Anabaena lutea]|uniref:Amino acid adenylation domain-containing protein n=1 Tax=Anabaena lutea FACHB-196 TaxID=2692881 RepID=A0ABR8FF35_9NOST|nr:non-ribosomal peptide synthetase [Anabaena lutea]MBD2567296.1 amino acid adenylation domain-containing protein [Anabaena lutea FACHB-196]
MKNIEDTSFKSCSNIERFWRGFLRGFTAPVTLPALSPDSSSHPARKTQEIRLSNSKTSDLITFGKNNKLSLHTLIQAAVALLLSHYTRETDILFGSTTEEPDFNIVPVRVSVEADVSVLSWLKNIQKQWSTLTDYEYIPLEQIRQYSEISPELPLFEMLVIFGNYEKLECFEYPLILSVDAESDLLLKINYQQTRFADDAIARMLGHLETLLTNIINLSEKTLADIPLLTEREKHQLLIEWNQTEVDYPQDKCIHLLFEEQVEKTPDAIAVVFVDEQLTYQELNERANQLANYLQKLGVNADKLVGLCLEPSLARIIGLLGILKAGGVYLPLDPVYPQERLRFMIEDSQVSIVLTQASLATKLSENSLQVVSLDADWEKIARESTNNLQSCVTGENLAYVIYTSGSTGTPKGVLTSHQAIAHHSQNIIAHYQLNSSNGERSTSGDRILQFASLSFDVSLEQILPTLAVGATLILVDTKLLTIWEFNQKLIDYNLTVVNIPPAYFTQWLLFLAENAFTIVPHQLRLVICGGEALPVESLKIWQNSPLRRIRLINAYGPTETTITAITFTVTQENTSIKSSTNIPIGRPLPNRKVYILDQQKNPVPIGIAGELYIGGEGLAQGYLNQPKLTEDKFITNPFDDTSLRITSLTKLYKTGDLACYLPDGNIKFLGRIDNQVKIRGFRIELGEIEAVLNQHPNLREAKVITREDIPGDKRLVAYIISTSNQNSPSEISTELRQYLKEKLPEYMIPSAFVMLETFPLTPNGKIDSRALPVPNFSSAANNYVAPRTPTEEILVNIWSQVLKTETIGINDNFFELGGHSLIATQIISRIRQTLNREIPLRLLFESPTIAQLSSQISTTNNLAVTAIEPRKQQENLPLSFAQQRLWFLDQLEPNSTAYNIPYRLQIQGLLNISILEKSISEIIQRHEILHTNFISIDGQAKQVITAKNTFSLPLIDLQSLPEYQQKLEVEKIAKQESEKPFNLAENSLFRIKILQLNAESHILLVNIHHIIFDGWSFGILFAELKALYTAYSEGVTLALPPLPIQYADFTLWQRQWLSGEVLESQLNYWERQLGGTLPILELPTDRPRPRIKTYAGATKTFILSPELTANIKSLCQQDGVTLFMTLLTTFKVLLCRYSGQEDVIVGTPIAGRNHREIEGLMGFFVNTLALRTDLSDNPIFRELLSQVKQVCLEAYTNQDVPFEQLVEVLQPERNLSHTPIFQVMFVLQNTPIGELELPNLYLTALEPPKQTAKFDLTLLMEEKNGQLIGEWEYNTDLFDGSTIERMIEHFQMLLSGILVTPDQNIWKLPLLTERERHHLLVEWNQTQTDYPQNKCIHQLFEEQVEKTPDAVAVVFENEQLTYRELNQRANQLANYLQILGVQSEKIVGICVERSLEMIVGLLGILKAGGAYLPLDFAYPQERISRMLDDAQVAVLLTQKHLSKRLPQHQVEMICLDTDWLLISQAIESNPVCEIQPENLAYVIYTSGSTGEPKGVMIQHSSVVNLANGLHQAIYCDHQNSPLRVSLNGSLTFDTSVKQIIQLIYGHSLNIVPEKVRFDGNAMLSYLQQQKIDVLDCTPSHLGLLIAAGLLESDAAPQYVLVGGEPIDESMWTTLAQAQNINFYNVYGPTECTVDTTVCLIQIAKIKPVIGRPIANVKTYILDEYLQPVPINMPGELHIGGAGLARGYVNAKELTQKKFIPNPFDKTAGSRLYKTGDLARYLPNGEIEYLGRIDNQVKIRGFRIELGEIEAVLNQHSIVREAKVITREDIPGDKRLVAYIIPNSKENTQGEISQQIREYLKQKLPDYMIPSAFVVLESFSLTTNGKIDYRALPAPDFSANQSNYYIAPRTPREEIIANIWSQVLKVEKIGIDDNFFELGGHSLLATQVISRIRQSFNLEIPLRLLFEFPTIAQLSSQIGNNDSLPVPQIEPRKQQENLPLSFAQQRLWFLDQLEPNSTAYNMPYTLRFLGVLNISALEQSISEIIQRHEILRTNIISIDGQPIQVIINKINFNLPIIDLQSLPDEQRSAEAERIADQEAQQPFNLAEDFLFRVKLLRVNQTEHWLLFNFHHIIFDGWSSDVFRRELAALYQAFSIDNPSFPDAIETPLSPLPIQYADFALWQREWLAGEVLESQLNYWKQHLGGQLPFLELPTDRPRPSIQRFHGRRQSFPISSSLTQSLKTLSQQEGVTLFMTMLAAFYALLYRYSGQEDIIIGTPIAGRHRLETESLIGFFINTLCLRIQLDDNPSFAELLKRVREVCLGAYEHQDMPFEKLVEELQPTRDLSRSPIFQVMFILQNTPKSDLELSGLSLSFLETDSPGAKFDLTLSLTETDDHLIGNWTYNTDLFESSTIARMTGHFQTLLEGIVAHSSDAIASLQEATPTPNLGIAQLPLLTATERQQMLVEWNNTYSPYPQDTCIHHLFESIAAQTPNTIAVVFETQKLTYQELNCRANQLAHYLQKLGVSPEVTVGIAVERSLEMIVGVLGIFKAGGAYVPLDPALPQARLDYMLKDTGVGVLLTQKHLAQNFADFKGRVVYIDQDWQEIDKESSIKPISNAKSHNLAYIIYTSGSTGQPKGVMVEHHSLCGFAAPGRLQAYCVNSDSRVLLFGSLSFSTSLSEIFMTFMAGATLYIARQEDLLPGSRLAYWLREYAITHIKTTPSVLAAMPDANFPLLSVITVMGEPSSSEVLERWLPGRTLLNSYGATEASVSATRGQYQDSKTKPSIGHPIANTQIYLLDTYQQPVPVNVPGEIYIAGVGVARGYMNQPDLTAERFIANPFSNEPKARMYKTGDLGIYLSDGQIVHLGRIDNQVKIRGFRIELGEIETILGQHPSVEKVVVIAREDSPGNKRLVAYVVLQENQKFSTQEMRVFLEKKVPNYMIPTAVVVLDFIPLMVNGKLDRIALPAPKFDNFKLEDKYTTPADNLELQLTKIWENVLGVQPIGLNDNFFDVGGHSLLAVRLFAQIEKIFGKNIALTILFQAPTIRQLANVLRDEGYTSSWSSLVPIQPHGSKRPFFYIHTIYGGLIYSLNLLSKLDADQPVYGLQAQGLDGKKSPHTCIEDMASHYIKEIQTVQPHGPYLLGGWCAGGVIAYEMAQQLYAQGETVELLTIFDAFPPKMIPSSPKVVNSLFPVKRKSRISKFTLLYLMDMIQRNRHNLTNLTLQQQVSVIWEKINRRIQDRITETVYQFYVKRNLPLPHSLRHLAIRDAIAQAYRNYCPTVYPGKVIFFKAVDQSQEYARYLQRWEELAAGGLEIHDIPGNHDTLMAEPHVSVLAEKLRRCLQT